MTLPAHWFLERRGIPYEVREFPSDTPRGTLHVSRALGMGEEQIVKTLIFVTDSGEAVLVMLPASASAISGNLKKAIASRDIRLAGEAVVQALTGYRIGCIPPFSWQPEGFRSFLDASLSDQGQVGVGAGEWGHEILLSPRHLAEATGAVIANLTVASRPVFTV